MPYRSPAPSSFPSTVYELYVRLDGVWEKVECATVYTTMGDLHDEQLSSMYVEDDFYVRRMETSDHPFSGAWFDATDEARRYMREIGPDLDYAELAADYRADAR